MPDHIRRNDLLGLMRNPLYAALPGEARAAVESRGHIRRIPAGQQFFQKGEKGDGAYVLLSGKVQYSAISPSGRQSLLNVVEEGKWLGDISTLDGEGRTMDCWTLTDSTLLHLPTHDFLTLVDTVPSFARMLILLQAQRVRELLTWVEVLTKLDAEGRLAARLLIFARGRGQPVEDGIKLDVPLTQEKIAEFIGATRQRVNQIINLWQSKGIIRLEGRHIVLCDLDTLQSYLDLG